eukprot:SAG25_NODE_287_length_10351_cov_22.194499_12_plen_173_part_00
MPRDQAMQSTVAEALRTLQPDMALYEAKLLSPNGLGWAGAEHGYYLNKDGTTADIWSTGGHLECPRKPNHGGKPCAEPPPTSADAYNGRGVPGAAKFIPKTCDTTFQGAHGGWFFSGNGTRTLCDLIAVYHGEIPAATLESHSRVVRKPPHRQRDWPCGLRRHRGTQLCARA